MNARLLPASSAPELGRLRRVLLFNVGQATAAVVFLTAVYLWVLPSVWFLVVIGLVLGMVGSTVLALRRVERGDGAAAVMLIMVATGGVLLPVSAIAPVALLMSPIVLIPPVVLAASFVPPRVLRRMLAAMTAEAVLMVLLARLQNGVGLEEQAPPWLIHVLVLVFVPSTVTLVALSAWLNHRGLWTRTDDLRGSRERLAAVLDDERRRAERDLHDGAQQLLIAASLQLRIACRVIPPQVPVAAELAAVGELLTASVAATRAVAHGMYPAVLSDAGLGAALRTISATGTPVKVVDETVRRQPQAVEAAVYFCCLRAVHSAGEGSVTVRLQPWSIDGLRFVLSGRGPRPDQPTVNEIEDRAGAVGGIVECSTSQTGSWEIAGVLGGAMAPAEPVLTIRPVSVHLAVLAWAGSVVQATFLYVVGVRNPWMLVIAGAAVVGLAVTWQARATLAQGSQRKTAQLMLGPFAASAVLMTALAPQALHYTPLTLLLGVLFVVPTARPREAPPLIVGACLSSLGLVALGRFQSWTGLREDIPKGLFTFVLMLTIPALFVMMSLSIWSNHHELLARASGLRRSSARLAEAAAEARRALAADVDQGALQLLRRASSALTSIRLDALGEARALEAVAECRQLLGEADQELQRLVAGLFPPGLTAGDLAAALEPMVARSLGRVHLDVAALTELPIELTSCLYFCCLESVNNSLKHAGDGAEIRVRVTVDPAQVSLVVTDDGSGFDQTRWPGAGPRGQGLQNMADRLDAVGGMFEVRSRPGAGTVVSVTVRR